MIEIAKTKNISLAAPSASYTRIANSMLKDAKTAFGESPPDEVVSAYELIRQGKPVEEEYENDRTFPWNVGVGGTVRTIQECRVWGFWGEDLESYVLDYYFFKNAIHQKTYFGVKHAYPEYGELQKAIYRQKGKLRYFCTQRPPSPGGIPDGYVTYDSYPNSQFRGEWCPGEVTYNEPPPEAELRLRGLRLDPDWEQERNRYV